MPPPEPLDRALYARAVAEASARFLAPTSIYRSAWIVRRYKELGGRYATAPSPREGLARWFREQWVDLNRRRPDGTYAPCGRPKATAGTPGPYPLCRPTRRATAQTPRTAAEIPKATIARAKREKQKIRQTGRVSFTG